MGFGQENLFSGHAHVKTSWMKHQIHKKDGVFGPQFSPPFTPVHKTPTPPSPSAAKISPTVLFIIVILAVLFFISGLLHLLLRFLTKHQSSSGPIGPDDGPTLQQRQLQQLFHLHDSGLDQAFIDALPVFVYREVVGPVGRAHPFDCAVCLCEFAHSDNLRLLPTCSHAFHIGCIDTWLLSNSTCPLCRNALFDPPLFDFDEPPVGPGPGPKTVEPPSRVWPVRLGKFRKLAESEGEAGGGETSSSNLDARRCYSMGSYEYVVGDTILRVPLNRERNDGNANLVDVNEDMEGKRIDFGAKTDSLSVSKIWLWSKKRKFASSSENGRYMM